MRYGIQKVWTDDGWTKTQHCMLVVSIFVAGGVLLMACWAVVIGWSAVIERLAK
jgi:hypothetical protein